MRQLFSRITLLAMLVVGLLALPWAAQAQGDLSYFIFNVNKDNFPDVTFDVRIIDPTNNQVKVGLGNNLTVFENGQQITNATVTEHADAPVHYVFVIDQGQFSGYRNFPNIKQAITSLDKFFKDGTDTATVFVRQNAVTDQTFNRLDTTNKINDLDNFVALFGFDASRSGPTQGFLGIQDALNQAKLPPTGTETVAVIFITRFVESPGTAQGALDMANNIASIAKPKNVSVYVMQADFSGTKNQPLQALASLTSGKYILLKNSTIDAQAGTIYQEVNNQRTIYTVKYRSTSPDTAQRQITINGPQPSENSVAGQYSVSPVRPAVTIDNPGSNTTITRQQLPGSAGQVVFDTNTVEVVVSTSFSDTARAIKSVELVANGKSQGILTADPGQTQFKFQWDVTDITAAGVTPVTLQAIATDELGLQSAPASTTLNISVVKLEPTTVPTATAAPLIAIPTGLPANVDFPTVAIFGSIICIGFLFVVPFSFLVFYLTRPTQAKKVVKDIQNTLIGGAPIKSKSLASVTVLEGPKGLIKENISISKAITTIGRNPKMADIVFYPDEESSVSRLHCTIQLDGKAFKLTDNNSTSGTRLNGRRLAPNDPVELQDGDEIVLGDLGKLGVKIRFGFLMDKTQLPSSGTASDKTFIMDDYDKDDWDKYKDQ
jgi:FHA domain